MSIGPEGPGWWIASDGRWYPPELHPWITTPPPVPPVPPYQLAPDQLAPDGLAPDGLAPDGRRRRRRRARLAFLLGAVPGLVLTVVAVVVATSSSSPPGPAAGHAPRTYIAPLTGFAGYHWVGPVTQVSARWRVPAIDAGTSAGHAATWIGAQNADGGPPFIQVGVTEDKFGPGAALYEAFWSDTAVSFHPQPLGAVTPGDLLSAAMVRRGGRWTLTLHDTTTGVTDATTVTYGAAGPFTAAEWTQEDPTDSAVTATDLPYPKTTTVAFQDLLVDGHPPTLGLADGQTLTAADGIILVPSPLRHDAFSLQAPTGAAAQYLTDAATLDAVLSRFTVQLSSWSSTPAATRAADVDALAAAYRTNASELQRQSWPAGARSAVTLLIAKTLGAVTGLEAWKAAGMDTSGPAFVALRAALNVEPAVTAVRTSLTLPPP